jgi:hippurate hydrolase
VLSEAKSAWSGTLMLVFQPAEETLSGARAMITDGLFDRFPKPDVVFAQHVGPLPAGFIGHREAVVMAAVDEARITLYGRGGHGAMPDTTIDPVLMAASVVVRLQGIIAREVPPQETAVLTVGRLTAGTKANIIPDQAEIGLSIRTYSEATRTLIRTAIERIVNAEAAASAAPKPPLIEWPMSGPVLTNDVPATRTIVEAFTAHFGPDKLIALPPVTASEDAGHFGHVAGAPTVFWFWGGPGPDSTFASNHSPEFAPAIHPTLETGVEALTTATLTWFAQAATPSQSH